MKKGLLLSILISISLITSAQTPVWVWANSTGGRSSVDASLSSVKDNAGNLYVCGEFEGTVNIGGTSYTSVGFNDIYVSKYDVNGTHQWTTTFGGASNLMFPGGIAIDAGDNLYLTGTFTFRLDAGGFTYFSTNSTKDIYLIKMSPNGGVFWAKTYGLSGAEDAKCISLNGNSLYIGGSYNQTFTVDAATFPATTSNNINAFVLKTDTAGVGLWATTGGGAQTDAIQSISSSANAIFFGGYIQGSASFGGVSIPGSGSDNDMLLGRLDPTSGSCSWAKGIGAASTDQINSVGQDASDNVYAGGSFLGTVTLATGIQLVETGSPQGAYGDGFIAKFNPTGTCLWARKMGGNSDDITSNIAVAANGSVYGTGYFRLASTFTSSGTATQSLTTVGGSDFYAVKYSPIGSLLWALRGGTTTDDRGKSVCLDNGGFCYVLGNFFNTLTIGTLSPITSAAGLNSAFIARLNGFSVGVEEVNDAINVNVYPNPANDKISIDMPTSTFINTVEIYNVTGQLMMNQNFSLPVQKTILSVADLTSGQYILKVVTNQGATVKYIQINK